MTEQQKRLGLATLAAAAVGGIIYLLSTGTVSQELAAILGMVVTWLGTYTQVK